MPETIKVNLTLTKKQEIPLKSTRVPKFNLLGEVEEVFQFILPLQNVVKLSHSVTKVMRFNLPITKILKNKIKVSH